jgi:predicted phosphate transport protein (TIGR00153 family)
MISAYQSRDENRVFQHHNNIVKYDEESTEIKRGIMKEVAEVGMLLLSREDFLKLSSEVSTIANFCAGISFRLVELTNRKWKVPSDNLKDIAKLADATLDCITRLRETVLSLSYGGAKTIEIAKNVESAEKIVDNIYRKVELKIISSDLKIPVIFMLRDIASFLEGIADVSENANDIAKILAITM